MLRFKFQQTVYLGLLLVGFLMSFTVPFSQPYADSKLNWSDQAFFTFTEDNNQGELVFNTYLTQAQKQSAVSKFMRKKVANVEVTYVAELVKNGQILGRIGYDYRLEKDAIRDQAIPSGIWTNLGSHFRRKKRPEEIGHLKVIRVEEMKDGNYEVKFKLTEVGVREQVKGFPFTVENGKVIGDTSLSKKEFMRNHSLRRLDGLPIFLSAN
ncbi:MAG: hypothetical protein AAGJ18_20170 [Bacteroidota bacterium]